MSRAGSRTWRIEGPLGEAGARGGIRARTCRIGTAPRPLSHDERQVWTRERNPQHRDDADPHRDVHRHEKASAEQLLAVRDRLAEEFRARPGGNRRVFWVSIVAIVRPKAESAITRNTCVKWAIL